MNQPETSATPAQAGGSSNQAQARSDPSSDGASARRLRSGRLKLVALFALFAAPVIASYTAYYFVQPQGRTNYGDLIEPQRQANLTGTWAEGAQPVGAFDMTQLRGRWVFVTLQESRCDAACEQRLYLVRQVRLTTGKERDRIERLHLLMGESSLSAAQMGEHQGLKLARPAPGQLAPLFGEVPPGSNPADYTYLIDPLGNLMMRFPPSADANRVKKDLSKLLKASRIG